MACMKNSQAHLSMEMIIDVRRLRARLLFFQIKHVNKNNDSPTSYEIYFGRWHWKEEYTMANRNRMSWPFST